MVFSLGSLEIFLWINLARKSAQCCFPPLPPPPPVLGLNLGLYCGKPVLHIKLHSEPVARNSNSLLLDEIVQKVQWLGKCLKSHFSAESLCWQNSMTKFWIAGNQYSLSCLQETGKSHLFQPATGHGNLYWSIKNQLGTGPLVFTCRFLIKASEPLATLTFSVQLKKQKNKTFRHKLNKTITII